MLRKNQSKRHISPALYKALKFELLKFLNWFGSFGRIEVQSTRLIDEQFELFRAVIRRTLYDQ
jgi:hypothetical protein